MQLQVNMLSTKVPCTAMGTPEDLYIMRLQVLLLAQTQARAV